MLIFRSCFLLVQKSLLGVSIHPVINDSSTGGGGDGTDEDCGSTSYRTRSLPSWGKNKQRPLSNADDLEELYAKVGYLEKDEIRVVKYGLMKCSANILCDA